ncbi:MAG: gamma interferon inducible lysosomal thiol reductase-domain-containing protein [Monoraphidium minutum]|nr:MAG: gamma interferon inducible lysosomal thiol reductase-domain-containing protein [Monoraphidium minutum]
MSRSCGKAALMSSLLLVALLPLSTASADRVRVEFYGEALCPYCIKFTLTQLSSIFENGLAEIVELEYIPAGNARLSDDGAIACQHGQNECDLNRAIACGLAQAPDQADWFPFLHCLEAKADEGDKDVDVSAVVHACAPRGGLVPSRVMDCYSGPMGDFLQRRAVERTASLNPEHKWVPWVVVNGIPLFDDFENVETFICAAYGGYPKPKYCLRPPPPDPSLRAGVTRAGEGAGAVVAPRAAVAAAAADRAGPAVQTS